MELRVFQRHGHVAGKLVEEADIVAGEPSSWRVEQLQHADDLARGMADGQAQQRLGAVVEALIEGGIKQIEPIGIICVDQLSRDGNMARDSLAEGDADLLMIETGGGNRPKFLALLIGPKDGTALSFDFSAGDFEDQFQKLS